MIPQQKQLAQPANPAPQHAAHQPTQQPSQKEILLAQLNDAHRPNEISVWPLAPGWWLLGTLIMVLIGGAIVASVQWHKKRAANKYRRTALAYLNKIEKAHIEQSIDLKETLHQLNVVTKQAYFAAYPGSRLNAAGDSGVRWYEWLNKTLPEKLQGFDFDTEVFELSYQPENAIRDEHKESVARAIQFCRVWINKHPELTRGQWRSITANDKANAPTPPAVATEAQHV